MLTRSMRRFAAIVSNDVKKGQTLLNIHHVYTGIFRSENTYTVYFQTKPVPLNETQNISRDLSRSKSHFSWAVICLHKSPSPTVFMNACVIELNNFNSSPPGKRWLPFRRRYFQMPFFVNEKFCSLVENQLKLVP